MFVVVGEALVDLVGQRGSNTYVAHPGGSPANVALGLARLGSDATLITSLGEDQFGSMVTRHLESNGVVVDTSRGAPVPTSLAIAGLAAGVASYDFRIAWDVGNLAPLPVETRCLHTGSLATALEPGASAVLDLVRQERQRGRVTISYDPNVRPALLGDPGRARPGIERLVGLCDVVKVSDEDLRWLYPDDKDEEVAARWLASGPVLVIVTRGAEGVYAVTQQLQVRRPAVPVDMVDTVGAGDSYTGGLLDGLRRADLLGGHHREELGAIDEATLVSVLDRAALIAAITCSRAGANPPTRQEVDTVLAIHRPERAVSTRPNGEVTSSAGVSPRSVR